MTRADPLDVVWAARSWIGTPYVDQASARGAGTDCLGLARGIWREIVGPEALLVPPYSRDWGEVGAREVLVEAARALLIEIQPADVGLGALVLFRMRVGALAKHVGILTAPARFVHARERLGVIEEPFTTAWRRRVSHAFVFPARRA